MTTDKGHDYEPLLSSKENIGIDAWHEIRKKFTMLSIELATERILTCLGSIILTCSGSIKSMLYRFRFLRVSKSEPAD